MQVLCEPLLRCALGGVGGVMIGVGVTDGAARRHGHPSGRRTLRTARARPLAPGAAHRRLPDRGPRPRRPHVHRRQRRAARARRRLPRRHLHPPSRPTGRSDQVFTCGLPDGPEAAPLARARARRRLESWNCDEETVFTTELIVSELVGNAVRYGAPPLELRLIRDQALTCEVSDGATSAPHVRHARTVDENGRGLFIVAGLADRWGTRYRTDGKTVWAQQPPEPTDSPARRR
ncbi:ATP-binding protein [Streptomyces sp. NPDC035033]|uniref:ATP-binding protein n=1 Tax=Streptomyces sp. NPDC035033 TaxID=3155368 RepID=UPI0033E838C6